MRYSFLAAMIVSIFLVGCKDEAKNLPENTAPAVTTSSAITDSSSEQHSDNSTNTVSMDSTVHNSIQQAANTIKNAADTASTDTHKLVSGTEDGANKVAMMVKDESTEAKAKIDQQMDKAEDKIRGLAGSVPSIESFNYTCGNNAPLKLSADKEGNITIKIDGEDQVLKQVVSASGAKYSNSSYTFWEKAGQATLMKGDNVLLDNCKIVE